MHRFALRTGMVLLAFAVSAAAQQSSSAPTTPTEPSSAPQAPPNDSPTPPVQDQSSQDQAAPSNGQQDTFVFKRQVEEVVLHATVVDEKQHLVTHLDRGAFTVFQDGQPQTISSFRSEDVPVAIGIVIDNSSSMRAKRDEVNRAVLNLVRASNPQDEVFVVNFTQNSYLDQDFTSDVGLLERALYRTSMQGSTALYDAMVASAAHFANSPPLGKKILLVITDGEDNMSALTLQEAARRLQQKDGPTVYAIGLMGTNFHAEGREAIARLANASGGTAFFPASVSEVSDITRSLAHDIRNQYTITYRPGSQKASQSYHPIVVEAQCAGCGKLTVHTRNGYYTGESVH